MSNRAHLKIESRTPLLTLIQLFYFTANTGSQIGLGDIVPLSYFMKMMVVVLIWYTQITCKIVFRGLSFFIKTNDLERLHLRYTYDELAGL